MIDNAESFYNKDTGNLIHIAVMAVASLILYIFVNRFVNRFINNQLHIEDFDETNYPCINQGFSIFIWSIDLSFIIFVSSSLRHIATKVLAVAGIIVAVIGFVPQQVLSKVIGRVMKVTTKPISLYDWVI